MNFFLLMQLFSKTNRKQIYLARPTFPFGFAFIFVPICLCSTTLLRGTQCLFCLKFILHSVLPCPFSSTGNACDIFLLLQRTPTHTYTHNLLNFFQKKKKRKYYWNNAVYDEQWAFGMHRYFWYVSQLGPITEQSTSTHTQYEYQRKWERRLRPTKTKTQLNQMKMEPN